MSPGVVVSRVLFAGNQLFRMEEFFVGALAYLICEDTLISMSSLTLHTTQYTLDTTHYTRTHRWSVVLEERVLCRCPDVPLHGDTLISMSSLTLHITHYTLDTTQYIHTTHYTRTHRWSVVLDERVICRCLVTLSSMSSLTLHTTRFKLYSIIYTIHNWWVPWDEV